MPTTNELAEYLLQTAPEHQGWSLVESPNSAGRYEELRQWAQEMTYEAWTANARQRPAYLGLVLLWLESEVARRHGGDATLWPILSNNTIVPWNVWVHSELFNGAGQATQTHQDLLLTAAKYFSLRHTFDEDEGKNWYRLIYLQFGFTHDDAVQRLASWLSGQILPISIQKLLASCDSGAQTFQMVWRSLRMFRLGNLKQGLLESRLRTNPWLLLEWCNDLIEAARKSSAQLCDGEDHKAAEVRFLTGPELSWPEFGQPLFTTTLCNLDQVGLESADYQLKTGASILARLIRQADGSYYCDAAGRIPLPIQPTVHLALVGDDGSIAAYDEAVLWDPLEEVTLYSSRSGAMLKSEDRLRPGAEVFLIASGDATIRPTPLASTNLALSYRLHRIAAGWEGQLEALLDDDVVWTSRFGGAPPPRPGSAAVSAHFTRTLDLAANEWSQVSSPWKLAIQFRIPAGWSFTRLRWRRADGHVVQLAQIPSDLSLTELDAMRPVVLRIRISSDLHHRTEVLRVTVPFVAALRWTAEGNPHHHPPTRKLLLGEARRQTWSFSLPTLKGEPRDPQSCSFAEGGMLHGRLKSRPSTLPDLAGYGAPLRVLEDPYVKATPVLEVTPCVLDDGVIGAVTWVPEENGFHIKSRLTELGEHHRLFVWYSVGDGNSVVNAIPSEELKARDDGWVWCSEANRRFHAVTLMFRGVRIGSWFDPHTWSYAAVETPPGEPSWTAAMLRAWKAPVLQNEGRHFRNMVAWLRARWVELLPAWLASAEQTGPSEMRWQMPVLNTHWQAAVNELLTAALPSPDGQDARHIVQALAPNDLGVNALGNTLWQLTDMCPILAARVARAYLAEFVLPSERVRFLNLILKCQDLSVSDERAEEIGKIHGNRDGFWLQQTVPTLAAIEQGGAETIPFAYRLLSKSKDYRFYALGRWLSAIQQNTINCATP